MEYDNEEFYMSPTEAVNLLRLYGEVETADFGMLLVDNEGNKYFAPFSNEGNEDSEKFDIDNELYIALNDLVQVLHENVMDECNSL